MSARLNHPVHLTCVHCNEVLCGQVSYCPFCGEQQRDDRRPNGHSAAIQPYANDNTQTNLVESADTIEKYEKSRALESVEPPHGALLNEKAGHSWESDANVVNTSLPRSLVRIIGVILFAGVVAYHHYDDVKQATSIGQTNDRQERSNKPQLGASKGLTIQGKRANAKLNSEYVLKAFEGICVLPSGTPVVDRGPLPNWQKIYPEPKELIAIPPGLCSKLGKGHTWAVSPSVLSPVE